MDSRENEQPDATTGRKDDIMEAVEARLAAAQPAPTATAEDCAAAEDESLDDQVSKIVSLVTVIASWE
jgi:hypothetical protein